MHAIIKKYIYFKLNLALLLITESVKCLQDLFFYKCKNLKMV